MTLPIRIPHSPIRKAIALLLIPCLTPEPAVTSGLPTSYHTRSLPISSFIAQYSTLDKAALFEEQAFALFLATAHCSLTGRLSNANRWLSHLKLKLNRTSGPFALYRPSDTSVAARAAVSVLKAALKMPVWSVIGMGGVSGGFVPAQPRDEFASRLRLDVGQQWEEAIANTPEGGELTLKFPDWLDPKDMERALIWGADLVLAYNKAMANVRLDPETRTARLTLYTKEKQLDFQRDLSSQIEEFLNQQLALVGPSPDRKTLVPFFQIVEDGHTVDYAVYYRNGSVHLYQGQIPQEDLHSPEVQLIVIQNTLRAQRPGRAGGETMRLSDETPSILEPAAIRGFHNELVRTWQGQEGRWALMYNPYPIWPPLVTPEVRTQMHHITLARADGKVYQSEIFTEGSLLDQFRFFLRLNDDRQRMGKEPFRLAINSWYTSRSDYAPKAGASQNQAHSQLIDFPFPIERYRFEENLRRIIGSVKIFTLPAFLNRGTGILFECPESALKDLVDLCRQAIATIAAKGDACNILLAPGPEGGLRLLLFDRPRGTPLPDFDNEWAFSEVAGAPVVDKPSRFYELDETLHDALKQVKDPIRWIRQERDQGHLTVHGKLYKDALAALRLVTPPPHQIEMIVDSLRAPAGTVSIFARPQFPLQGSGVPGRAVLSPSDVVREAARNLSNFLAEQESLPHRGQVDGILVAGSDLPEVAVEAARLFHDLQPKWIMVTGGRGELTPPGWSNEASIFKQVLIDHHVPADKIVVEDRSTNAFERAQFSLQLIQDKQLDAKAVVALHASLQERRFVLTLKHVFGAGIHVYPHAPFVVDLDTPNPRWNLPEWQRRTMWLAAQEIYRLLVQQTVAKPYPYIAPIAIPTNILQDAMTVTRHLQRDPSIPESNKKELPDWTRTIEADYRSQRAELEETPGAGARLPPREKTWTKVYDDNERRYVVGTLAVTMKETEDLYRISLVAEMGGPLVCHWGIARDTEREWIKPEPRMWPENTIDVQDAAQTELVQTGSKHQLEWIFLKEKAPLGLSFVLLQKSTGHWIREHPGCNFYVPIRPSHQSSTLQAAGVVAGCIAALGVTLGIAISRWPSLHLWSSMGFPKKPGPLAVIWAPAFWLSAWGTIVANSLALVPLFLLAFPGLRQEALDRIPHLARGLRAAA
jgi:hypothetical protein